MLVAVALKVGSCVAAMWAAVTVMGKEHTRALVAGTTAVAMSGVQVTGAAAYAASVLFTVKLMLPAGTGVSPLMMVKEYVTVAPCWASLVPPTTACATGQQTYVRHRMLQIQYKAK